MSRVVVILCWWASVASAAPPSGYQCSPGTAKKGVGCTCPAGHAAKRDSDNVAVCATAEQQSTADQFVKAVKAGDLRTAQTLARKINIAKDQQAVAAYKSMFAQWLATATQASPLLASRGQCGAIRASRDRGEEIIGVLRAMFEPLRKVPAGLSGDSADAYRDQIESMIASVEDGAEKQIEPLDKAMTDCIAVASRDDGTEAIAKVHAAHKAELARCFAGLPETKQPLTAKVVVEADGKVVDVAVAALWADLDASPKPDDKKAAREIELKARQRRACFQRAIEQWTFQANARGFAATITIARP